jgi:hypothetical protein
MKLGPLLRERCHVTMHLTGGFTRVMLDGTLEVGMADGGVWWDIPTQLIPVRLRPIGSRLLVARRMLRPEPNDSPDEIRSAAQDFIIEPLPTE